MTSSREDTPTSELQLPPERMLDLAARAAELTVERIRRDDVRRTLQAVELHGREARIPC